MTEIKLCKDCKYHKKEMKHQELKELLTPEFLSTLHAAVECCNWKVDMIESMKFCDWCYNMAGQPEPEYDMSFKMEAK